MKGIKTKSGFILILILMLVAPKGSCASSASDTVYLSLGQYAGPYIIQASGGDKIKWSFHTYNDTFTVSAFATGVAVMTSIGISDSGTIEAMMTGSINFLFMNAGPSSGYIDISIRIKEEIIEGYNPIIFTFILISIISIIAIKKKNKRILRTRS